MHHVLPARLTGFLVSLSLFALLGCSSSPSSGPVDGAAMGSGGAQALDAGGSGGAVGSGGMMGGGGQSAGTGGSAGQAGTDAAADSGPATDGATSDGAATTFALTGPWPEGGVIPSPYACNPGTFPVLNWTAGPAGTASYVFALHDLQYMTHFVIFDIPVASMSLPPAPAGSTVKAGFGNVTATTWVSPCPPTGVHHYVLTVYALNVAKYPAGNMTAAAIRTDLERPANAMVLGRAVYTGTAGK